MTANAFAGTFALLQPTKPTLKKSKEPASQHTMTYSNERQTNTT